MDCRACPHRLGWFEPTCQSDGAILSNVCTPIVLLRRVADSMNSVDRFSPHVIASMFSLHFQAVSRSYSESSHSRHLLRPHSRGSVQHLLLEQCDPAVIRDRTCCSLGKSCLRVSVAGILADAYTHLRDNADRPCFGTGHRSKQWLPRVRG